MTDKEKLDMDTLKLVCEITEIMLESSKKREQFLKEENETYEKTILKCRNQMKELMNALNQKP